MGSEQTIGNHPFYGQTGVKFNWNLCVRKNLHSGDTSEFYYSLDCTEIDFTEIRFPFVLVEHLGNALDEF